MDWISVKDKMPPVGERVEICYERKCPDWGTDAPASRVLAFAEWQDGTTPEEDTHFDFSDILPCDMGYDEENDRYLAPKGWYEELTSWNSEYFCIMSRDEVVTHWRCPELPEEV